MAGARWPVGTAPGGGVTLGVYTYPPERFGADLQNLFRSSRALSGASLQGFTTTGVPRSTWSKSWRTWGVSMRTQP